MRRFLLHTRSRGVAFAILVLPRIAEACPTCASQQPGGTARIAALGVMLLLPFAVAFIVVGALRRAGGHTSRRSRDEPVPMSSSRASARLVSVIRLLSERRARKLG